MIAEEPAGAPADDPDESFRELIASARAGDQEAAKQIHLRWTRRLIKLARVRLGRTIVGKEDPEDVVQSVYRSFFRRFRTGSYRVEAWADVWALLATIARRKCSTRRDRYRAFKRDARRELPLMEQDAPDGEPTAEQATILAETVERLLGDLGREPKDRTIIEMSLQGHSAIDIYEQIGCSERTVHRLRKRVREQLERWNEEHDAGADGPRAIKA